MIDLGISKLALIGVVALIVIGPEKLPRVARTVGTLLGKAQRYVADVKAEVNRSIELEELKRMKDTVEHTARDVESSMRATASNVENAWADISADGVNTSLDDRDALDRSAGVGSSLSPTYQHPRKNWRLKRAAVPQWYKSRNGVRNRTQSGAARVARFRPRPSPMPR